MTTYASMLTSPKEARRLPAKMTESGWGVCRDRQPGVSFTDVVQTYTMP